MAPNAGKVYDSWGFDLDTVGGVDTIQLRHVDGPTVKTIWHDPLPDMRERWCEIALCASQELHTGLLKHLKATEGHPVKSSPETEIADIDCERGIIRTSEGSAMEKDLIVLANELEVPKCRFLDRITGKNHPLLDTDCSAYRYLRSAQEVLDGPETRPLFESQDDEICIFQNFAASTSIVTYLSQGGKTRGINVSRPGPASKGSKAGDAAHAMKPQQGQGASIAIESTGCLEVLCNGVGKEDVQSRLKLFDELRRRRCPPAQLFSNMPLGPNSYSWLLENIKPSWDPAKPLPSPGSRPLSKPYRDVFYGYNAREESEIALAEHQKQNSHLNGTT
ncbi:MAG: Salicylate hydroxylase [Lasallia pustulata]|uniref:Salicylate hydroxylase n=1 Tax=Lasallia pustulata TaxID=136370 RepID=A0A5M8PHR9_9LECA|nr:MAG: Salicylate hydroxylase [Lasallia pustulata]